eukprot:984838-Pleurochrysis_carterae.AAC.1
MSLSGVEGEFYAPPCSHRGGPAFLLYYSPAFVRNCAREDAVMALCILAEARAPPTQGSDALCCIVLAFSVALYNCAVSRYTRPRRPVPRLRPPFSFCLTRAAPALVRVTKADLSPGAGTLASQERARELRGERACRACLMKMVAARLKILASLLSS